MQPTEQPKDPKDDEELSPLGPTTLAGKVASWVGVSLVALYFAARAAEPACLLIRDGFPEQWTFDYALAAGLAFLLVASMFGAAILIVADQWRRRKGHEEMNDILDDYNEEVAGAADGESADADEVVFEFEEEESTGTSGAEEADSPSAARNESAGEHR